MSGNLTFLNAPCEGNVDLDVVLRRYGFLGSHIDCAPGATTASLQVLTRPADSISAPPGSFHLILLDQPVPELDCRAESAGAFLFERGGFLRRPTVVYRSLLPSVSFTGKAVVPLWTTREGRTVLGWWRDGPRRTLVVGLQVVEEIVRYTQGDPNKVVTATDKSLWGHGHERATYLYEDHVVAGSELSPWADQLGYTLARLISEEMGIPLLCTLPQGAAGGVFLTGDDDAAEIESYEQQRELIGDFPITYLLLPSTKLTTEKLSSMPGSVEFGAHIDALAQPERYDVTSQEQTRRVGSLLGRPPKVVRNHGHLNHGYWGHLPAWEACGLDMDLNVRGLDGTCPTGSYLPFRVRRLDGSWSEHWSLFSTLSDSMQYLQKWSEKEQARRITGLANQIERMFPGVIVFNLHPVNALSTRRLHEIALQIGRRPGWIALAAESYLRWLQSVDAIRLTISAGRLGLSSSRRIRDLALWWPSFKPRHKQVLPDWEGTIELSPPKGIRMVARNAA